MRLHVEVIVRRGGIAESRHRVQMAASDPSGALIAGTEDPGQVTTLRSAAKPFQLLPLVERGHADRWGFGEPELAVMAASHTGSARHLEVVRGVLVRIGLGAGDLACGYHDPIDRDALAHLAAHPEERSPLYNNCSGKHAGMLCLARSEGWPTAGYERADHPVQQLMHRTVSEVAGLTPDTVEVAIDGCNLSVFAMPLSAIARAYARLAVASEDSKDGREAALARIRRAMTTHPELVGGAGRLSTSLMLAIRPRIAKGGAEGLECIGASERGLGVALKVEDGGDRAVGPAIIAVLEQLGLIDAGARHALESAARPSILNAAGRAVGALEAVARVPAHATN